MKFDAQELFNITGRGTTVSGKVIEGEPEVGDILSLDFVITGIETFGGRVGAGASVGLNLKLAT